MNRVRVRTWKQSLKIKTQRQNLLPLYHHQEPFGALTNPLSSTKDKGYDVA